METNSEKKKLIIIKRKREREMGNQVDGLKIGERMYNPVYKFAVTEVHVAGIRKRSRLR